MNFTKISLHDSYAFNCLTEIQFHMKYATAYSSSHEIWNISKTSLKTVFFWDMNFCSLAEKDQSFFS